MTKLNLTRKATNAVKEHRSLVNVAKFMQQQKGEQLVVVPKYPISPSRSIGLLYNITFFPILVV